MRWLAYIILVVSLLLSACGTFPKNTDEQIAVIDWQKACSVHPHYEALQKAKADLDAAIKFRNEQAEQGKKQIVLLNKLVEIKQSGKQSYLAADFATRMAEREAQEHEKLASDAKSAKQAADEIIVPEQEKILETNRLAILNLRLKLENVKLTPEERSGSLTDGNLSIVETGVSVYTYATNHPINTHCVVSMIGLPTFEGMDSVLVMKVKE